jgi:hypothetical protein
MLDSLPARGKERRLSMSTMAYGAVTGRRKRSPSGKTKGTATDPKENWPPGLETWVDSFTALVPGEVLVLHGVALYLWTDGTKITNKWWLFGSFFGLVAACVLFYFLGQGWGARDRYDVGRVGVTVAAFLGWSLAQKPSALDAVLPVNVGERPRIVLIAVIAIGGYHYAKRRGGNKADLAIPPGEASTP